MVRAVRQGSLCENPGLPGVHRPGACAGRRTRGTLHCHRSVPVMPGSRQAAG